MTSRQLTTELMVKTVVLHARQHAERSIALLVLIGSDQYVTLIIRTVQ